MTGLDAGPKMLAGLRCVHILKKRVLLISPGSPYQPMRKHQTPDGRERFQGRSVCPRTGRSLPAPGPPPGALSSFQVGDRRVGITDIEGASHA
jgi:hypothetical protein